ncbi:1051_t:CDS:2, partial [Entrophospora sp. SA101]
KYKYLNIMEIPTLPCEEIRFSSNGSQFVTSSLDGSIKIWDTINEGCIKTIENAHDDSTARLWEANSGKLILKYE